MKAQDVEPLEQLRRNVDQRCPVGVERKRPM
jgi:hypothetical protein